ncbi:putative NADH:ubiquinone reductase (H(+)-translocating) [Helianthus anomalus]
MNSIEFPLFHRTTQNSVISTTLNDLSNWSKLSSLWPLLYGTSCCFIEFASLIGSRFDFDRYGLVPRLYEQTRVVQILNDSIDTLIITCEITKCENFMQLLVQY